MSKYKPVFTVNAPTTLSRDQMARARNLENRTKKDKVINDVSSFAAALTTFALFSESIVGRDTHTTPESSPLTTGQRDMQVTQPGNDEGLLPNYN